MVAVTVTMMNMMMMMMIFEITWMQFSLLLWFNVLEIPARASSTRFDHVAAVAYKQTFSKWYSVSTMGRW